MAGTDGAVRRGSSGGDTSGKSLGRRAAMLVALLLSGPAIAQDWTPYCGLMLGSAHIGNDDLNGFNPGVTLGWRAPLAEDWEQAVEVGVFYNSYEEVAPFVAYAATYDVGEIVSDVRLRVGPLAAIARYADLAPRLEDSYGIPNVEGFIPVVGLMTQVRVQERTDLRLITVPPGDDADLILAFTVARTF